jgi:hypothetical protein
MEDEGRQEERREAGSGKRKAGRETESMEGCRPRDLTRRLSVGTGDAPREVTRRLSVGTGDAPREVTRPTRLFVFFMVTNS